MGKLPYAIICAPTKEDAQRLCAFVNEYDPDFCSWVHSDAWGEYKAETCYTIEDTGMWCGFRKWYENPNNQDWERRMGIWPDDPRYQFCSVDEYIALVTGNYPDDPSEESDLQFGDALAELL